MAGNKFPSYIGYHSKRIQNLLIYLIEHLFWSLYRGIQQGDPFGLALFSISIDDVARSMESEISENLTSGIWMT